MVARIERRVRSHPRPTLYKASAAFLRDYNGARGWP